MQVVKSPPLIYSSPTVAGGKVYVGSTDNKVYSLNAAIGDTGSWPMCRYNNAKIGTIKWDKSERRWFVDAIKGNTNMKALINFLKNQIAANRKEYGIYYDQLKKSHERQ